MLNNKYTKLIGLAIIIFLAFNLKLFWEPYYNHYFTKYNYQYNDTDKDFIIHIEPYNLKAPDFLIEILKNAFPKKNIILDNTIRPNLIIRSEAINTPQVKSKTYQKWNAPYVTISFERYSIMKKDIDVTGYQL